MVARGDVPLALGTDTAGSGRVPADSTTSSASSPHRAACPPPACCRPAARWTACRCSRTPCRPRPPCSR
ncbi:hypothetical protein [Methylibium sp. T29-B]|uniref:hypothetical protein n=1 Tax=Methylibium sp. T29-B TaxID=1437443 RepID=UPI002873343A|nr:hypothetical protein [Methylibium sp. T29-B]